MCAQPPGGIGFSDLDYYTTQPWPRSGVVSISDWSVRQACDSSRLVWLNMFNAELSGKVTGGDRVPRTEVVGGWGGLYLLRLHRLSLQSSMPPTTLNWAAMRDILMFYINCEGQNQSHGSFLRQRLTEAERKELKRNRSEVVPKYQPNFLLSVSV